MICILFVGVNPPKVAGSKTGVFTGQLYADSFDILSEKVDDITGYEALGGCRCMMANRVSFFFDLKGQLTCIFFV